MTPPRRLQSPTEREIESDRFRREREDRDAAPAFECADVTGAYSTDPERLLEMRELRAEHEPARRIALIETEQKEQRQLIGETRDDVADVKVSIAEIKGDQKAHYVTLKSISSTLERMAKREDTREHITLKAEVEVETAEKLDTIASRKARRDFWLKMLGSLLTGGVVLKLLQYWGAL